MKRRMILAAGCIGLALYGCKAQSDSSKPVIVATPVTVKAVPPQATPVPATTQAPGTTKVKIKTKFGDMTVLLYDATPLHRDNFIKLVKENFYDSLLFHRCMKGFMAQGGDPNSKGGAPDKPLGSGGPGYTIPAEFQAHLLHKKGALAAARQPDQVNPEKQSSGSQFYLVQGKVQTEPSMQQMVQYKASGHPEQSYTPEELNMYKTLGGAPELDWDYTVFGEIIEGLEVLDAILDQPVQQGGMKRNRPLEDIVMDIDIVE